MRNIVIGMFLLFTTHLAQGAGYLVPQGQGIVIEKYHMHRGGGMTLWVSDISNPDNCGGTNKVHLKGDLPGHDQMVAAVMAAYASGHKVGLFAGECEIIPFWGGTITYPIILDLWVTD